MKGSRREQVLVEPYKQLRFGLMFLYVNFAFSTCMLSFFVYYMWDVYKSLMVYFQLDPLQVEEAGKQFMMPVAVSLILTLMFIGTTLWLSARYTHQIYGPLISIRRFLDDLIAGRFPRPIKLRTSDQLQDLAEKLNSLREVIDKRQNRSSIESLEMLVQAIIEKKEIPEVNLHPGDPCESLLDKLKYIANSA